MTKELDYFGQFMMTHFRDVAFEMVEGLCENRFDSPGHRVFQRDLSTLTTEQKAIVRDTLAYCVDGALNDFLYHLDQELRKGKSSLNVTVDNVKVTEQSSGLHKELHGPQGWKVRFSKFRAITAK